MKGHIRLRNIAILGATGSIGLQAADLVERHGTRFHAQILAAHSNAEKLFALSRKLKPDACALVTEPDSIPDDLKHIEWFFGENAACRALRALRPDDVLAAVVGIAGLSAVMTALDTSKRVLLANKEALVTGGTLVTKTARARGVALMPVDSEHSAIFQCLEAAHGNEVSRLILTASGGALRTWSAEAIERADARQVLNHPTWSMGAKITVDCAGMMNKGLEVIEAHHLFGVSPDKIEVVVHPESVIHSMVEFSDSAVLAQLGAPDMRVAIGYAMGYPERVPFGGAKLDFTKLGRLTFEAPDLERFPCLGYAIEALKAGGVYPIALNGANEAAVHAFLAGRIPFGGIARTVRAVLDQTPAATIRAVADVHEADRAARVRAEALLDALRPHANPIAADALIGSQSDV